MHAQKPINRRITTARLVTLLLQAKKKKEAIYALLPALLPSCAHTYHTYLLLVVEQWAGCCVWCFTRSFY
jgi:L-lysine 2,3-aminomutase